MVKSHEMFFFLSRSHFCWKLKSVFWIIYDINLNILAAKRLYVCGFVESRNANTQSKDVNKNKLWNYQSSITVAKKRNHLNTFAVLEEAKKKFIIKQKSCGSVKKVPEDVEEFCFVFASKERKNGKI